ncbi:hypothetical protein FIBSPDRAFT_136926 [Athelia psychrophila]|uniref:Uncharacterized protein n=1 Tax=Athelia psychrophila TaxID=1759441 RepID=A0A166C4K4_9AGAM|nr:hypothetical protein FIBSPDRAFT_136926 [Fibularhizoctonia sp. CBS 109695]
MHFMHVFGPSSPRNELMSIPVFVLTSATAIYLVLVAYIVLGVLNEVRPMWFYVPSGVLLVLSRLGYFLSNKLICKGMNAMINGSFVASICETAAVGVVYQQRIVGRREPRTRSLFPAGLVIQRLCKTDHLQEKT